MPIRQAILEDAEQISRLIVSLAHCFTLAPDGEGAERFLASITPGSIRSYISDPQFYYLVALDGSTLAGAAALRESRHVFHLFVSPAFQRQRLGRQLWRALQQGGASASEAITVNSALNAVPVYERFGFAATGPKVEMNGIAFVPMRSAATASVG
jgi:GNAT superfamily N-acetyltransferase